MIDISPPDNEDLSRYLFRIQQATRLKCNYDKLKYNEITSTDCKISDGCSILNVDVVDECLNAYLTKLNGHIGNELCINSSNVNDSVSLSQEETFVSAERNVQRSKIVSNACSPNIYMGKFYNYIPLFFIDSYFNAD